MGSLRGRRGFGARSLRAPLGGGAVAAVLPTANLIGDYNGTNITDAGSGRISAVLDQSGAGNHLTQAAPGNQPLQSVGGGPGGRDAIDFALLAGALTYVGIANIGGDASMSIYTVVQVPTTGHYICDGVLPDTRAIANNTGAGGFLMYAGAIGPAIVAAAAGTWIVHAAIFAGASSKADINGGTTATGDVGAGTDPGHMLGCRGGGATAGTGLERLLARQVIYSVAHDDATRTQVGAFLRAWAAIS